MSRWRVLSGMLMGAALLMATMPTPADASHSMTGGNKDCGTIEWSADLIKGRTDGMVVHAEHTVGCMTYKYTNLVGADREEMASDPTRETNWQTGECVRTGQLDVANHFKYYRDTEIDPSSVKVSCGRYSGPD